MDSPHKKIIQNVNAHSIPLFEGENDLLGALDKGIHGIAVSGYDGFIPPSINASGSMGSVDGSNT